MSAPLHDRPTVAISPSGAVVFWLSTFAIPCGIFLFSGPLLFLGGIGLILLAATRFLALHQMKKLRLRRRLPRRGFPGETFEVETEMLNEQAGLTSKEILLNDKLAGHGGSGISFPEVAPRSSVTNTYPAKVFRRGRLRVPQYTLTSSWPFGFFRASLRGSFEPVAPGGDTMLIAPKPVVPPFVNRILQQMEQEAVLFSELHPDDHTEFRSLREFRSGDSLQSIHWPASSRSSSIIVREFDPPLPKPQRYGVFLHQFIAPGTIVQPDRFEKILRIACGLLVRFRQTDLPVVVRIELAGRHIFRIPGDHHYHEVLDTLAEALSCPSASMEYLSEGWEIFEDCDQVFVLSDCDRAAWESKIEGLHPATVCIDPLTGISAKRASLILNPRGKILTR